MEREINNLAKLVRDNIPEIIAKSGMKPFWHIAPQEDFYKLLIAKLHEEVDELEKAQTPDEMMEECADVFEVLCAICFCKFGSELNMEMAAARKRQKNGAFEKRIVLDKVEGK